MMRRQRGIVLLIAMVAAVALAFAGAALVRAVSAGVAIGGNLAVRQQAVLAASAALEQAVATLFDAGAVETTADDVARNYFATRQGGEDRRGVPAALQALAGYPPEAAVIDAGDGYAARHVIERLCLLPGDASIVHCTLTPPSVAAAAGAVPAGEPPRIPCFRVTVRVDGPAGAASFVQGMLSATPNHRLSWRVLDE
ncbi:MAG TPA: hypothetical protein VF059_12605 [Casimicrobiaceae bacterium]